VPFGEFLDRRALFSPDSGEDALRRNVSFSSAKLFVQVIEAVLIQSTHGLAIDL
jgi:hypothetical protein